MTHPAMPEHSVAIKQLTMAANQFDCAAATTKDHKKAAECLQESRAIRASIATLQAQPAEVSDEVIERIAISHGTGGWQTLPDMIRFARAILALRPQATQTERITVQEAWEAAGGNPGIKASKAELLEALRQLDKVCDEATPEPVGEPVAWTIAGEVTDWSKQFSKYRTQHYVRPVYTHPAPQPATVVPEGFALVPVEPTEEMKSAGVKVEVYSEVSDSIGVLTWSEVRAIYRAMLTAAQKGGK